MAKARRLERLQALILRTVATTIQRHIRDPRVGIVSITQVKLSADLSQAVVCWSCLGDEGTRRTMARGLDDALPAIQRTVAGAMGTRVTPRLMLQFDPGMERAQRLDTIFEQLRQERGEDEPDGATPEAEAEAGEPSGEGAADAPADEPSGEGPKAS